MTDLITPVALARFFTAAQPTLVAAAAPALAAEAAKAEINTPLRIAHWMAQMFVETMGFRRFEENLDYSAHGLVETWPGRFLNAQAAAPYAHQPEKIANLVYASRNGNGPTASGDGWRYRGRGFLMRTFRGGYAQAAAFTGLDLVADPDQLADPLGPAAPTDAAGYWAGHRINASADADDIVAVTRAVNGGLIGLSDRRAAFAKARQIWSG